MKNNMKNMMDMKKICKTKLFPDLLSSWSQCEFVIYNWGEDVQVSPQFKYMIFHIIYLTVSSPSLGILRTHNLTSSQLALSSVGRALHWYSTKVIGSNPNKG